MDIMLLLLLMMMMMMMMLMLLLLLRWLDIRCAAHGEYLSIVVPERKEGSPSP